MHFERLAGRVLLAGIAVGASLWTGSAASAAPAAPAAPAAARAAAPAATDCVSNGFVSEFGPEFDCVVWPVGGAPVYAGTSVGQIVGHLGIGTNWVTCVITGGRNPAPSGSGVQSNYWLRTLSDKDASGHSHWGWVPATYIRGAARPSGPPDCPPGS